jgi:formate dehydrogenase iron-sulfur subunit
MENPDGYVDRIYGQYEVGGTSTLYISKVPFEQLGFKTNLPNTPLPMLTADVLSKIPNFIFWGGTLLGGIWWITNRRREVQLLERRLGEMEEQNPSNSKHNEK